MCADSARLFPVQAVDTVGAGDAFTAGLAAAIAAGQALEPAVRMGNACGALAATRPGAQPAMPRRADVERLLGPGRS